MQLPLRAAAAACAAALALAGLTACSSEPGTATDASVTDISVTDSVDVIAEPGVTVVDVRTPEEFASGHLPGAINVDVSAATFDSEIGALPQDGTYVIICRSGNRSATAADRMAELGFTTIYNVEGGVVQWQAAGGSLVTD